MTTSIIATCDHGIVCKTKRVIMDRDVYDKKWKLGPYSVKKQQLKQEGKLDKHGKIQDNTPEAWKLLFGEPDKAVKVNEVVAKLGKTVKAEKKEEPKKKKEEAKKEESEEEEEEKPKKDKKKKKKVVDSDDDEEEEVPKKDKKSKKEEKPKKKDKKKKHDSDEDSD